jgi:cardiolipin synthase (CMP-forming)
MGDHLPNFLTLGRIALIPLFVAAFFLPLPGGRWIALALFLIAAITDYADGFIARARNAESRLGQMLDPIADKLLVATALMMLVYTSEIKGLVLVPALVILAREILVSGMREFLATIAVTVPVTGIAKLKTTIQVIALSVLIGAPAIESQFSYLSLLGIILLWLAALLTLYTGFVYVQANLAHMSGPEPKAPVRGDVAPGQAS